MYLDKPNRSLCRGGLYFLSLSLFGTLSASAQTADIRGRLIDASSGEAVPGAEVRLAPIAGATVPSNTVTVSDAQGLFLFEAVSSGPHILTTFHLTYGSHEREITVPEAGDLALLVEISTTFIRLDPVVVRAQQAGDRASRARGTARRVAHAEDLRSSVRSGTPLIVAMSDVLPGLRVTSQRSSPGQPLCLEFRGPVSLIEACKAPAVVVDGVRQANGLITLNSMAIENIASVEVLPPGEAGVLWGAESNFGVILIETYTARTFRGVTDIPTVRGPRFAWELEGSRYPWLRSFATAFAVHGLAYLGGRMLADRCLSFENVSAHFYGADCSFLGNTGARLAVFAAPPVLTGWVAERMGQTDLSSGNRWGNAVGAAAMAIPGVILSMSGEEDGFGGSRTMGVVMVSVGAPLLAVSADRLIRRFR